MPTATSKDQWSDLARFSFIRRRLFNAWVLLPSIILPVSILQVYRYVYDDYQKFLALGPGGNPSTFGGYLRVTYLRIFFAHKDPFQPPSLARAVYPKRQYLHDIPQRSAPRPQTDGIAPHRQLNQYPPTDVQKAVKDAYHALVEERSDILHMGDSCFEKHGMAIFLAPGTAKDDPEAPLEAAFNHLNETCKTSGEVAHVHDSDSSMHVTLHPADAALVIAAGWGQRHPVAGVSVHGTVSVPDGFTMIYAPQSMDEVDVVMDIVKAGAWWVGGVDLGRKVTT